MKYALTLLLVFLTQVAFASRIECSYKATGKKNMYTAWAESESYARKTALARCQYKNQKGCRFVSCIETEDDEEDSRDSSPAPTYNENRYDPDDHDGDYQARDQADDEYMESAARASYDHRERSRSRDNSCSWVWSRCHE